MIRVHATAPIAIDSDDHLYPDGIYLDNNVTYEFVNNIENQYGQNMNFLDLGCAGGALVCALAERGINAVGIDGSDHCLNFRKEAADWLNVEKPLGYDNWQTYGNTRLFTADITKEFQITHNDEPMKFDLITAWDVMEHFFPERIDTFMEQIKKHLKPDGYFVASIAKFSLNKHNIEYHKCNFPNEWWVNKLSPHLNRVPYPFSYCNRNLPPHDTDIHLLWCGQLHST